MPWISDACMKLWKLLCVEFIAGTHLQLDKMSTHQVMSRESRSSTHRTTWMSIVYLANKPMNFSPIRWTSALFRMHLAHFYSIGYSDSTARRVQRSTGCLDKCSATHHFDFNSPIKLNHLQRVFSCPRHQSINQSVSQSVNQPTNQSVLEQPWTVARIDLICNCSMCWSWGLIWTQFSVTNQPSIHTETVT